MPNIDTFFEDLATHQGIISIPKDNIAEDLEDTILLKIGRSVMEGYTVDKNSMEEWEQGVKQGLNLLKQEKESRDEPWPGAANFKSPTLMSASLKFSDRASTELLRGREIVKIAVIGDDPGNQKAERAKRVSEYQNYQLNIEMPEWREEHDKLLYDLPNIGTVFKKTFFDPRLGRNTSNLVCYPNFVVNNDAKSILRLRRFSELFELSENEVKERQYQGLWLDVDLNGPSETEQTEADNIQEFIEQQGYFDIDEDGYEEPYTFTVHRNSQKVVRIIPRFTKENVIRKKGKITQIKPDNNITKYGFLRDPQGGFLDVGYGHLLGALTAGINANTNQLLDAGSLSNKQGGWLAKGFRKKMGDVKVKAGVFHQTNLSAQDLQSGIMPYPIKEPSIVLFQLMQMMISSSQELSASADLTSALGANAPATTTLALVQEQQLSAGAIILRIYRAMSEEFKKLFELNSKFVDPTEYRNVVDDPQASFEQDFNLTGLDIVPVANPEVSSRIQRIQMAQAELSNIQLVQMAGGDIRPLVINFFEAIGSNNIDQIFPEETPEQQLQRILSENPDLLALITQEQERLALVTQAEQAAIERQQEREDLKLATDLEKAEKEADKLESETLLNLEKAESEEAKNLRDDYTTLAKTNMERENQRSLI